MNHESKSDSDHGVSMGCSFLHQIWSPAAPGPALALAPFMRNFAVAILAISLQQNDLPERLKTAYVEAADALVKLQMSSGAWPVIMPERQVPSVAYTALTVRALSGAPPALQTRYQSSIDKGL